MSINIHLGRLCDSSVILSSNMQREKENFYFAGSFLLPLPNILHPSSPPYTHTHTHTHTRKQRGDVFK